MAVTQTAPVSDDHRERSGRRRPFTTWVKKLANFKNASSSEGGGSHDHPKRDGTSKASKKRQSKLNNPYPQSGRVGLPAHSQPSVSNNLTGVTSNSPHQSRTSLRSSVDGIALPTAGIVSVAPTFSTTDHDASRSINAPSHMASSVTGTSRTANGGLDSRKGGDSTFSSPAPSERSLTTTLTTIQSMAVNGNGNNGQSSNQNNNGQNITFSQPFPTASPASALPQHLAPHTATNHPTTYNSATANNLLTDNASILTLASSSKNRRRRSLDTDASVRALAPSSLWGGSRESLPLSVLSANIDGTSMAVTPVLHQSSSRMPGNERTSIYSATGIAPAIPGERNSFYAKQSLTGDAASVRSGLLGHGRAESIAGSVGGVGSPLASPMELLENDMAEKSGRSTPGDKNASSEKAPSGGNKD